MTASLETDDSSNTGSRNRSIRDAISMSLVSKVTTLVLQMGSLPLVARKLEIVDYGIFTTISMSITMVILLEFGIGPALGKAIAEAYSAKQKKREATIYFNGLMLVVALSVLGVAIAGLLITVFPISTLFGQEYSQVSGRMTSALWVGIALFGTMVVLSHIDRTREGYMEASITHIWGSLGNLGGAIAIIATVLVMAPKSSVQSDTPTINYLLIALFAPQLLARLCNLFFLWRKRPHLNPITNRSEFCPSTIKTLFRDGLSFTAAYTVVFLIEINLCSLIIGRIFGPADVAIHQATVTIMTAFSGALVMIGTPLWAAFANAKERGDVNWMISSTKKYYLFFGALSLAALIGLTSIGPWMISKWFGPDFIVSRSTFVTLVLFLTVTGWRQIHFSLSLGLDLLGKIVKPIVASAGLGLLLGILFLNKFGLTGLFLGQALGVLITTSLQIPKIIWKGIKG